MSATPHEHVSQALFFGEVRNTYLLVSFPSVSLSVSVPFFFLSHLLPQEQPSHYQKMKGPVFAAFVFHSLHNNNTNIPPQFAAASNCDRSASPITAPAETALYSGSHQYGPLPACAQTAATRMCNTRIQRASCRVSSPPPLSSRPLPLSVFCCNQTSGFCPKFS